jgi:type IV secretion system protein VirB10
MKPSEQVHGERTIAQVSSGMTTSVRLQRALAMILVGAVGGLVLVWYYFDLAKSVHVEGSSTIARRHGEGLAEMQLPSIGAPPTLRATKPIDISADGETGKQSDTPAAQGRAAPHAYEAASEQAESPTGGVAARRPTQLSPVLVRDSVKAGGESAKFEAYTANQGASPVKSGEPNTVPSLLGNARSGERPALEAVEAGLQPDRRWLLPKGTFIDCTLETAIDTTLGGLATCVVATDVFGSDGRVVLLDRGTRLLGQVASEVRAGQARVGIVWDEARAPSGVIAMLGAPGTDALGRAGIAGTVDRHSGDRFGAAVLLSLIDGAVNALVAHQQTGGGSVIYNAQGSRDIATEVLRNTMNVAPTIRVAPGARMLVAVARDIDFRHVYSLTKREGF